MEEHYALIRKGTELYYTPAEPIMELSRLASLDHPIRARMLQELSRNSSYPLELAKRLGIHEQTAYYHLGLLLKAGLIEVVEKREVRGTIAKAYRAKTGCLVVPLHPSWQRLQELIMEQREPVLEFLKPFTGEGTLAAPIVVGSPDPHGPLKARARDGHYAADLALFLGGYLHLPRTFCVTLDVDVQDEEQSMILLGGPITNLMTAKINEHLGVRFSETKPFGLHSGVTSKKYNEDHIGLIARVYHPKRKAQCLLVIAGLTTVGTKSAVIALSRFTKLIMQTFTGQKEWYRVVQGFDLDGDGKIDSVEVLE